MNRTFLLLAALASTASADVKLPALFTDHLVLQRDKPVPVWGWADPGEEISVEFAGQTHKATADKDGAWKVSLEALSANAEPAELQISGKNKIVFQDVLVGEVWICSGQSNMEMRVSGAQNARQDIASAKYPEIRFFTVPEAVADEPQKRLVIKDVAAPPVLAAVLASDGGKILRRRILLGREIHQKLSEGKTRVPVGLIDSSWGGTRCEAWTSKPAVEALPGCKAIITGWEEFLKVYNPEMDKKNHNARQPKLVSGITPAPLKAWESQATSQHRPGALFNAMINPLAPYAIRGAIWYQGEANQGRAVQYQTLLPAMIKDWRTQWRDDFSFHIVQLAGYGNRKTWPRDAGADDTWAELQWAQLQTAIETPHCGLAVTNDIGDENNIHPTNKQEVGRRLALQALAKDYKKAELVSDGPIYAAGACEGNQFVVNFSNAQNGLKSRDGGDLKGFIIAGEDKVWKPAKAVVHNGTQLQVWSDEVKKPVAVRYAWASWSPEANLVNLEGLPASLFRSDNWDLSTKGIENPYAKPAAPAGPKNKEGVKPGQPWDGKKTPAKKAA